MELEEQRQNLNIFPPSHSFFPGSTSLLYSLHTYALAPSGTRRVGNKWLWPSHNCSSLLLLLPPTFPHPVHGLQSFRIKSLQYGSSMGHSADTYCSVIVSGCSEIYAHLHRLQFLSEEPAPEWALNRWQFFQDISTCFGVWSSSSCSEGICSAVALPMGWREIFALESETPLSFSSSLTLVFTGVFSQTFFSPSLHTACAVFYLSFNMFSPRHHQFGWWAQLCPAVGLMQPVGIVCVHAASGWERWLQRPLL